MSTEYIIHESDGLTISMAETSSLLSLDMRGPEVWHDGEEAPPWAGSGYTLTDADVVQMIVGMANCVRSASNNADNIKARIMDALNADPQLGSTPVALPLPPAPHFILERHLIAGVFMIQRKDLQVAVVRAGSSAEAKISTPEVWHNNRADADILYRRIIADFNDKEVHTLPLWRVWVEGFMSNKQQFTAQAVGRIRARTFPLACELLLKDDATFDSGRLILGSSLLFDNETEARKKFG